jgi:hypothetical protein
MYHKIVHNLKHAYIIRSAIKNPNPELNAASVASTQIRTFAW